MSDDIVIAHGFAPDERDQAARLFWQAFSAKLGKVLGPEQRALSFFSQVMNPDFALSARDGQGRLLGLAGFKTAQGGLTGGSLSDLARVYGRFGSLWRALLLGVLERKLQPDVLQMDGIFVAPEARGQGVVSRLLDAIVTEAATQGLGEVQLDVIDINPRARSLYERVGFEPIGEEQTGPFQWVFGFASATRMRRRVSRTCPPPGPAA